MPILHSPPARQTRSLARAKSFITPTPRAPSSCGHHRSSSTGGPIRQRTPLEEAAPSRKEGKGPRRSNSFSGVVGGFPGLSNITFKGPGEDGEDGEENSVEEEYSNGT
ncbi:hypothetical protein O181_094622 [Austropuccinia psidii MF-1]|uniref:Uncharacterized protein n=1 Tax=Austropuccinia psidii MF-1 TaxID=1389203 RepID=A0A9Q3J393_9BASI|nr:hypothetical protein [Austropuccinia psidii MF-1]